MYTGGMATEDRFSTIAEITRRMKIDKVREFGDSPDEFDCDLLGFCACVRASKQLFAVYHAEGPMAPREAAAWSAMMLSCDEIFVVADAYCTSVEAPKDDPNALLPMSPEQMEEEFYRTHPEVHPGYLGEAWQRGEREGISEAIMIQRYAMVGPALRAQYMYTRQGRKLIWGKILTSDVGWEGGAIDDYVKEGFRRRRQIQPQIDEMREKVKANMAKEDFAPAEMAYWTDRGAAKFLSSKKAIKVIHYMSQIPDMPDAYFAGGKEIDPTNWKEVED